LLLPFDGENKDVYIYNWFVAYFCALVQLLLQRSQE